MKFFWHRDRKQQELQQELQSHLQMATGDKLSRGESARDAESAAHREFGNLALVEQITRDQWGSRWLEEFLQDLRYGARMLRKNPGFTAIAVLTLALGIGVNATIFSWIRAVLLNPLQAAGDSSRVVALEELAPSGDWLPISYPDFRDLRDNSKLLDSMTASYPMALAVGEDRHAERISGELVSANLMSLLAGIAFVLAAMGLYGVMAFAVAQRTREIGIRLAMGAQRSSVLRLVARQAAVLLVDGLTAGLLTAAALGHFISWMLFSVSPSDASVYAFAATATILIAVAATLMPAVRAMRVDPLVALRYE